MATTRTEEALARTILTLPPGWKAMCWVREGKLVIGSPVTPNTVPAPEERKGYIGDVYADSDWLDQWVRLDDDGEKLPGYYWENGSIAEWDDVVEALADEIHDGRYILAGFDFSRLYDVESVGFQRRVEED